MDITVRKNHANFDKIAKKSTKHTFLISSYFLFLFIFISARFILKDENLLIYGSLAYKEVLQKISLGGVFTCLILIIVRWVERLVVRKFKAAEHYNLVRVLRLISILLISLVIISILFVNFVWCYFTYPEFFTANSSNFTNCLGIHINPLTLSCRR